ncbi:MAG: DNA gyrase/topoisomerase IV subunit A [Bacteroidales bacterium]|jgi:topoisomerase-4 subunit A|nr:DNA gyrase/topoisomerase IV subunit A [Bacteroidales bacterium]
MAKKKEDKLDNKDLTPGEEQNEQLPEEGDASDALSEQEEGDTKSSEYHTIQLSGMYENWFLDYASYVILERAVPNIFDGLKPVQRRILHAMKDMDDGRFNKVANIIGHTMKYHPHGDASIGDALVQLGQKDLLVETQGNWGNILTGDSAAAPRYIEARLSKFALEVIFNPKTTAWKLSYDGRNKEPLILPVKFPLLLAQGVEGIAVGLASKILPHNFNELIDASVNILKNKDYELLPDFPTGGLADFSRYNNGLRGGRVRVRARINQVDRKTLSITEVPYGTTTGSLIDSILAANDKGKIKIKKIDDNTAENVEILIHLASNVSPDQTIDALYAFTNCEVSISPNSCVIDDDKPRFLSVQEMLDISTQNTVELLRSELMIRKGELEMQWHYSSLEKIFIEERIYRKIENSKTWESVLSTIDKGLDPFKDKLSREVTRDDIIRLTEIKIKRISKYNSLKADELIRSIEEELEEVQNHLDHLIDYAINYFRQIKKKYGKGRDRRTELRNFDTIEATAVVAANQKLYLDREEGFAGTALRKHEYICDCSDIDDLIVFRADGSFIVTRVTSKTFVGKNVIHIGVFKKGDDRTIYNMVYRDGKQGNYMVKRFPVKGITRDKEYILTKGTPNSKVHYFSANPNGEAEVLKVVLRPNPKLKIPSFEYDFSTLAIKGRSSYGNILTKKPVKSIVKKEEGVSTLGARDIWFDDTVKRLNVAERGTYLGAFMGDDRILEITSEGYYRHYNFDLSTHFDEDMVVIEKSDPRKIMTAVFWDAAQEYVYIKRFQFDVSERPLRFIGDHQDSKLLAFSLDYRPVLEVKFDEKANGKPIDDMVLETEDFIGLKSHRAKGKRLTTHAVKSVKFLEPLPYEHPESEKPPSDIDEEDKSSSSETTNDKASSAKAREEKPETSSKQTETNDKSSSAKATADKKDKPKKDDGQITLDL